MTAAPTAPAVKTDAELTNAEDLNNLLVAVNAITGQIVTEPVATGTCSATGRPTTTRNRPACLISRRL